MASRIVSPKVVPPSEVSMKMRLDYTHGLRDQTSKLLEAILAIGAKLEKPSFDLRAIMQESAVTITRNLGIASVAIGLWNPTLRKYKYEILEGINPEATKGFMGLSYDRNELLDPKTYPCHDISRMTKIFLGEEHPYAHNEEFSYNKPILLGMNRYAVDESLEADYLCTFFRGPGDEILGWMDISGTRMRKLPDSTTIRWIELIAQIVGLAVRMRSQPAQDPRMAV